MRQATKTASLLAAVLCALSLPSFAQEVIQNDELLRASQLGRVGSGADGDGGGILDTISFGGSVDVGYTYNFNKTVGAIENPGRVFDKRHNEFTLHNAILEIKREVNEDQMFGFGITPTIGSDGSVTGGGGLNFGTNLGSGAPVDMDVIEAYGAVFVLGGTVEIGKFVTNAGAEVIQGGQNANYSRSFLFGNAIPFTHTGIRGTRGLIKKEDDSDLLTLSLGLSNGWDSATSTNDGFAVLTTATLAPLDFLDFTANWFFGNIDRTGVGDSGSTSHLIDLVATVGIPGVEGLAFIGNFDWYGDENAAAGTGYADYWGFSGIVKFTMANPFGGEESGNFIFAGRGEYVDDADGFISVLNGGAAIGMQGYGLTGTIGYQPAAFFLIRGEVRYDHSTGTPFANGGRSHQTTLAVNTVFMF